MSGLQEKFQVILPPQPDEDDGIAWKTFESQRHTFEPGRQHRNNTSAEEEAYVKLNQMPQRDLENQNAMLHVLAGATDFSKDTNAEAINSGFTRQTMNGADDQYTGEHIDHFYGEAVDENGKTGFVERNNYLDRL